VTNTDFSVEQLLQETWERNERNGKDRDSIQANADLMSSFFSPSENRNKSKPTTIQHLSGNFDSTGTLSLPSFRNQDSSRFSHRPEVVDLVDDINDFNRSLIDSIVKPSKPSQQQIQQKNNQSPLVLKNYPMTTTNKSSKPNQFALNHRSPNTKPNFAPKRNAETFVSPSQVERVEKPLARSAKKASEHKKNVENPVMKSMKVEPGFFIVGYNAENKMPTPASTYVPESEFNSFTTNDKFYNTINIPSSNKASIHSHASLVDNLENKMPTPIASASYVPESNFNSFVTTDKFYNTINIPSNKASVHSQANVIEDDFEKKINEALQRSRQTCEMLGKPEVPPLNQRDMNYYSEPQVGRMTERIEKLLETPDMSYGSQQQFSYSNPNAYEINTAASYNFPTFQY